MNLAARSVVVVLLSSVVACADAAPVPAGAAPRIRLQTVVKGLSSPVDIVSDGSLDRMYVVEQPGRLRLLVKGRMESTPYLNISDRVTHQGECGFLGVAFHPQFAANGYFYVKYTTGSTGAKDLRTVVSEFHVDLYANPNAKVVNPKNERIIIEIPQPYNNHNGGQVMFGPDGMLYIGMGDGGSGGDPQNRAQNPQELLGKILRIDPNPRDGYAVPKDNPFVADKRFRPEIWALGLRNPWRFSFDRKTGVCYTGDVGQNLYEEVHVIDKGGN